MTPSCALANLKRLAAPLAESQLVFLCYSLSKLQPDRRKEVRWLEDDPLMVIRARHAIYPRPWAPHQTRNDGDVSTRVPFCDPLINLPLKEIRSGLQHILWAEPPQQKSVRFRSSQPAHLRSEFVAHSIVAFPSNYMLQLVLAAALYCFPNPNEPSHPFNFRFPEYKSCSVHLGVVVLPLRPPDHFSHIVLIEQSAIPIRKPLDFKSSRLQGREF